MMRTRHGAARREEPPGSLSHPNPVLATYSLVTVPLPEGALPTGVNPEGVFEDPDLVRAIAEGSTEALGALYDRHGSAVMGLCLRILGVRADAEEVLSDVFLQVWEQAERYEPSRGNVVGWLLTVARSRAIDRLRSVGRRERVVRGTDDPAGAADRAAFGNCPRGSEGPFRDAALGEQRARVEAALGALDPAQRRAVELSFFEDLSHSEIAQRLGEPLGTVKSRIRQGLIRLREGLRSQYGPEAHA
jgi:RNA polymerase sigma-70 factor (ECF subfamily)